MEPIANETEVSQRILVADDDRAIRELIAVYLIRSGYKVDTAKDGADAWKSLREVNYLLLITDYKMPKLTGLELIKKLRSFDMTLPVILVSGTMPTEELKRHQWLRVDATLAKPFNMDELLDLVKKVLNQMIETPFSELIQYREKLKAALKPTIPRAERPASAPPPGHTGLSRRILVVDDNHDTRQLSISTLSGAGYDVEGVNDGVEGWEVLLTREFDLVITDNTMPRMTGIEMIAKLYVSRPSLPIIMATEHLPTHEFAIKPWLTPNATLQRPFSNEDLLETVKRVLCTDAGTKS